MNSRHSMLWMLFALCLSAFGQAHAAEAGRLVYVAGKAQVGERAAALEQAVQEGDLLSTGADGYLYMKTVDSGFLILSPNTRARVITYRVDPARPEATQVKLELLKGIARSISGQSVKHARQNFRFNTPVAAIGIRGTDFIVYTNDQTSSVSVVSGGVVMSPFAGTCGPEGSGPCEGSSSRELFAGRTDVMLQVQRGQDVPQLLNGTVIGPELKPPVQPEEAPAKTPAATPATTSTSLTEVRQDVVRSALVVKPSQPKPEMSLPAPVITDPVVIGPDPTVPVEPGVPAAPDQPKAPELLWGRWQKVAALDADTAQLKRIKAEAGQNSVLYGAYVMARPDNSSFVMPTEGKVAFALVESEAFLQKGSNTPVLANIKDAKLEIDFAQRAFATSLVVYNELGQLKVSGAGDITEKGTFMANDLTGGRVNGILGGAKADEAIYSFKSTSAGDLLATGVTRWSR